MGGCRCEEFSPEVAMIEYLWWIRVEGFESDKDGPADILLS
jgi:hypothetical protein